MKLSPHCHAVTGLGYIPPWTVNSGFIAGDETTLIVDTGANALSAATIHGYATAVRPGNMMRVLNCEKHFDHIGGNSFFEERGLEIWGHPGTKRSSAEFADQIKEFNEAIPDAERRAHNEADVFYAATRLAVPKYSVDHEMRMDLGNCVVAILLTPGHTETNLSVWVPSDRVLFCADTLVNGYRPNFSAACLDDWQRSLARLRDLAPRVIVPGHGAVVAGRDVDSLFEQVLRTMQ